MVIKNPKISSRRSFLSRIWIGLGVVALLQFLAGAVCFLASGRKRKDDHTSQQLHAGMVADFAPDSVTLIARGHLYLIRLDDGGFLALSRRCTHLGCAVPWVAARKQFECPCHSSVFDITGNVIMSPAPRALDMYAVRFVRGRVMIDISRSIVRTGFSADQPAYPQELG